MMSLFIAIRTMVLSLYHGKFGIAFAIAAYLCARTEHPFWTGVCISLSIACIPIVVPAKEKA
jgi:hypothetical protein